jgi:hypothetical protein
MARYMYRCPKCKKEIGPSYQDVETYYVHCPDCKDEWSVWYCEEQAKIATLESQLAAMQKENAELRTQLASAQEAIKAVREHSHKIHGCDSRLFGDSRESAERDGQSKGHRCAASCTDDYAKEYMEKKSDPTPIS